MNFSFIILAYNDSQALQELIPESHRVLTQICENFEILVIDDASTDDTNIVIKNLQTQYPNLVYVKHEKNRGVGGGFKTGVQNVKFENLGYTDGDAQYSPQDLIKMLPLLTNYDAVSGNRVNRADAWNRTLVSKIYNFILRQIYNVPILDINSGLKVYRKSFIAKSFPLESNSPFYDAEVLIKGFAKQQTVAEIPISHFPRKYGIARGNSWKSIKTTIQCIALDFMKPFVKQSFKAKFLYAFFHQISKFLR